MAEGYTPGAAPNPGNKRQSFHYENIENHPYRDVPGFMEWANDPNVDPNAKVQEYLAQQRASGGKWAEDDVSALEQAKAGGPAVPKNATPAQQWNAQPAPAQPTSGTGDALMALLMERAGQGTNVSRNDPTIRAQVDPMVAQMERAKRNYLSDVAEARGPHANIAGEQRMAAERFGQQAGLLESQVIGREIDARRNEIQQTLQLWGSLLSNDQRIALQRELSQLEAALSREGMAQGNDQFMRELALREFDLNNAWDYRWLMG